MQLSLIFPFFDRSMTIVDASVSEGWVMITSQSKKSRFVSLYHIQSGRHGMFAADCGCFRAGGFIALKWSVLVPAGSDSGTEAPSVTEMLGWLDDSAEEKSSIDVSLTLLELDKLNWLRGKIVKSPIVFTLDHILSDSRAIRWKATVNSSHEASSQDFICCLGEYSFLLHSSLCQLSVSVVNQLGEVLDTVPVDTATTTGKTLVRRVIASCLDIHVTAHPVIIALANDGKIFRVELEKVLKTAKSKH